MYRWLARMCLTSSSKSALKRPKKALWPTYYALYKYIVFLCLFTQLWVMRAGFFPNSGSQKNIIIKTQNSEVTTRTRQNLLPHHRRSSPHNLHRAPKLDGSCPGAHCRAHCQREVVVEGACCPCIGDTYGASHLISLGAWVHPADECI